MSALIEIAESLLELLEEGGARQLPQIDFVVEGLRVCFRKGYSTFTDQVEKTFESRIELESRCRRLVRKFYERNRLRIAELVLTEREIG
jgi:hypothetical protein